MSLAEQADTISSPYKKGETCTVCVLMGKLPKADLKIFEGWLRSTTRYNKIAKALEDDGWRTAEGTIIDGGTIGRHARGGCARRERYRA